jgi:hypothetical protein
VLQLYKMLYKILLFAFVVGQGDQMSFHKNRPKFSPTLYCKNYYIICTREKAA